MYNIWTKFLSVLPVCGKSDDANVDNGTDHPDLDHSVFSVLLALANQFCAC